MFVGFRDVLNVLEAETLAFAPRPVVLVHGDSRYFRIDKPLVATAPKRRIANFTRVETFGERDDHWLRATVGPGDPNAVRFTQEIVEANLVGRRRWRRRDAAVGLSPPFHRQTASRLPGPVSLRYRRRPARAGRLTTGGTAVTWLKDDGADGVNRSANDTLTSIIERRLSRRTAIKGALASASALVLGAGGLRPGSARSQSPTGLAFRAITPSTEDRVIVADGYTYHVVARWGDPIVEGAPAFDLDAQSAERQARQFGFNCDHLGWFSLPDHRASNPDRGLLVVNHEYTDPLMMFPGYVEGRPTRAQVDIELAAHGMSVMEVERDAGGRYRVNLASRFNRRITGETPMQVTGPAAGHAWLRTAADPTGTRVAGMLNNCGGGRTPWGTVLTCEENFNQYFANARAVADAEKARVHARYGLPAGPSDRRWEAFHERFDLAGEPNEPFRFGWVVEIDPYDPNSVPRKRTALGRMKHEAATCAVSPSGRIVVYTGDDERFDYLYKFVSARPWNPADRASNDGLLDEGTLYVAKFDDDGTGEWLPLVYGRGPLTEANGFGSQGDVLVKTRLAADAVGATKMDRPEDVETNPVTGKVYCVMTNNTQRGAQGKPGVDRANPRANNQHGHVIELTEQGNDPAATTFRWEIFLVCGEPSDPSTYFAGFDKRRVSPISSPDNIAFDRRGNLWIATDGQTNPKGLAANDAIHAVPVEGPSRGHLRQFLSGVPGGEVASLAFNADDTALFASIQHPGEGSTLDRPTSRWPDGGTARPAVIAVVKDGGGVIGG